MRMIDILLKYILWHEFLNDLDSQSDFDKFLSQKAGQVVCSNISY